MMPIIAIRPQPGAAVTVQQGAAVGLAIDAFPLSEILPIAWDAPPPQTIDALLLGSANAVRHAGSQLQLYLGKPAFVVGPATAVAARAAGFAVAMIGQGGLKDLLAQMPNHKLTMLRIAARRHVAVPLPDGITVETRVAYHAAALPMPQPLVDMLRKDALVLLHSAGSAEHFAAECDRLAIDRAKVRLAALGPRIAEAAGPGWAATRAALSPRETELVALAKEMCH
ncbi:MAG: uroporphyrinogen-III synthase [Alteraurantiacibacter sp.]